MGIHIRNKGNFRKTLNILDSLSATTFWPTLKLYGQLGVNALAEATPKDSGKTAESWRFSSDKKHGKITLNWYNTNSNEGVNVAILLQYGHIGPGDVYVEGRDYINPAIQPVIRSLKIAIRTQLAALLAGK